MHDARYLSPESLLENADWMRRLARSLVRDASRAEDVLQEACLAAVERPPRWNVSPRGWLKAVVSNFAYRSHREERRREARERAMARQETSWNTPDKLMEQVELQRQIAGIVLELDEPYRSTVVLHYFHGLSPRDLANREGVAITTVRSRIHRALDRLRRRLDATYGGDRTWRALFLPLLASGAFTSTTSSACATICSGAGVGSGAGASLAEVSVAKISVAKIGATSGGLVMTQKTIVSAGLVALVVLAGGLGGYKLGRLDHPVESHATLPVEDTQEYRELRAQLESVKDELTRVKRERDELVSLKTRLEESVKEQKARRSDAGTRTAVVQSDGSGLNWSEFARLVDENIELLSRRNDRQALSPEEISILALLRVELGRIEVGAKAIHSDPFFDEPIFTELVEALYKDSLGLNAEQTAAVTELARSLLEGLPENAEELPSLEKYVLRKELTAELWTGVEEILTDDQLDDWQVIRDYSEDVFGYGGRLRIGVSNPPKNILTNWIANSTRMSFDSIRKQDLGPMVPIAESYARDARSVLERYANSDDELEALPAEARARFEQEMLSLQERFHAQITPLLTEEQRAMLSTHSPAIVEFKFGGGVTAHGHRGHF